MNILSQLIRQIIISFYSGINGRQQQKKWKLFRQKKWFNWVPNGMQRIARKKFLAILCIFLRHCWQVNTSLRSLVEWSCSIACQQNHFTVDFPFIPECVLKWCRQMRDCLKSGCARCAGIPFSVRTSGWRRCSISTGALLRPKKGAHQGPTKKGKGTKVKLLTDERSRPVFIVIASASIHEVKLVGQVIVERANRQMPKRITGDKAYDSDELDWRLKRKGIEWNAPHRRGRIRPPSQQGRKLRAYKTRWKVDAFCLVIQLQTL